MSSAWLLKTPQMHEAGREILLREALVAHMRSTRDRQILASIAGDARPLEGLLSFFASFYVFNYHGLRLFSPKHESTTTSIDQKADLEKEERRQLELEIRQLLGNGFREEVDIAHLVSEFFIDLCAKFNTMKNSPSPPDGLKDQITDYLRKVPTDYSPNASIDFINEITGWGIEARKELYAKSSGLKESALTLRDELLREHEEEIIEISTLKRAIVRLRGHLGCFPQPIDPDDLSADTIDAIVSATWSRFISVRDLQAMETAHKIRLNLLDLLEENIDLPTTLGELETMLMHRVSTLFSSAIEKSPNQAFAIISHFVGIPEQDVQASLRSQGVRDPLELAKGLLEEDTDEAVSGEDGETISPDDLEYIERSMRSLEKIEQKLEGPVKGMLRSRGLRASELEKVKLDFLTKDRTTLMALELQILSELKKKVRVPSPDEMKRLLELRDRVKSGEVSGVAATSGTEMVKQRVHKEAIASLRLDLVWYFMIGVMTNVSRVVETYLRSKHDMLRIRAVLKSIYEETETELQFLREEILIDLLSMRIYEMKCVHPDLDAPMVCSWLHARLSNKSLTAARDELDATPSPVFEGIVDVPLKLTDLEFDNYAIAYDVMHRFLIRQRIAKAKREEDALEAKIREQEFIQKRRKNLDVLNFIYTKSHTVFRVIGRVGTKGLEWGPNDDMKCANLLAFYIQTNRGRPICKQCGATPKDGICPDHGKAFQGVADDMDNLSVFVMHALSDIKEGLMGSQATPVPWDKARSLVQREISTLKKQGRITSKTNLSKLLPGEINNVIGPKIAQLIGKQFNESLVYAARRANLA
ncbi:MAG: hypothetical protein K9W43_03500 [Candidatus Thorarchaeota archaeon]|nr:hypothetical protein [Candidatus Thorarchaeota archaeon]